MASGRERAKELRRRQKRRRERLREKIRSLKAKAQVHTAKKPVKAKPKREKPGPAAAPAESA